MIAVEIVDVKNDQLRLAVGVEVGDRDCRTLIPPRDPVRDLLPGRPAAGDVALRIEGAADPIEPAVWPGRHVLHLEDDDPPAPTREIGDRDAGTLVLVRPPIGDLDPGAPAAGAV